MSLLFVSSCFLGSTFTRTFAFKFHRPRTSRRCIASAGLSVFNSRELEHTKRAPRRSTRRVVCMLFVPYDIHKRKKATELLELSRSEPRFPRDLMERFRHFGRSAAPCCRRCRRLSRRAVPVAHGDNDRRHRPRAGAIRVVDESRVRPFAGSRTRSSRQPAFTNTSESQESNKSLES